MTFAAILPKALRPFILFACVGAALAVAGCDDTAPGPGGASPGMHEVSVLTPAVKIAAPPGYCIDPKASVARGKAVVVLIGRCTARGGVAAALVSMTVGAPASAGVLLAGPDALAKFFTSAQGRRVLARDGVAGHVVVMQAAVREGSLFLHVNDTTAGEYWRAITAIRGRLVTISASGAEGAPLTSAQGLKLVQDMLELLNKRNPDKVIPAQAS
jgi:outer membrane murein-binding lipoprotein Lpp